MRNWLASSPESCWISRSIRAERQRTSVRGAARPVGESGPDLGLAGDRPLVDIDGDDERLLGQETEAPDEKLVLPLEIEFAEGSLLFEERPAPLEEAELPGVPFVLLGFRLLGEPLHAAFDDGQVAENELRFHGLEVADGVDGLEGMRDALVRERPDDDEQGVGRTGSPQELVAEPLAALPGNLKAGEIEVFDDGRGRFLGTKERGQPLESLVGDLDHGPALLAVPRGKRRAGARFGPGEGFEELRLPRER